MAIAIVLLLAVVAGALYRMGGSDRFNTKWRDAGVPTCMVIAMAAMGHIHWSLVLCFGALWGALTTYHKWVGYLFNRPDKHTVYLESWVMTGLCYGLALLPFTIATGPWMPFLLYLISTTVLVATVSELSGNVWVEEIGRGAILIAGLLFFL